MRGRACARPTGQRPVVTGVARGLRVVFVGTLWEAKGIDLLLGAFEPLWRELPELSRDLIGDGPLLPQLSQYLQDHPEARMPLRVALPSDRISRELAPYDLLALPSRR